MTRSPAWLQPTFSVTHWQSILRNCFHFNVADCRQMKAEVRIVGVSYLVVGDAQWTSFQKRSWCHLAAATTWHWVLVCPTSPSWSSESPALSPNQTTVAQKCVGWIIPRRHVGRVNENRVRERRKVGKSSDFSRSYWYTITMSFDKWKSRCRASWSWRRYTARTYYPYKMATKFTIDRMASLSIYKSKGKGKGHNIQLI